MSTTTFVRACAGYDQEFRRALAAKLITVITEASMLADANVMAIRPSETLDALADVLATILAAVPQMDEPAELEKAAENLAKRLRHDVAAARAEGCWDWAIGAKPGGTA
jgi:DNA-binding MurR/RpiR family transcriptional regulator